ncbi:MAG: hypothetical protein IJ724_01320 [Muribaculaceae bacterium]|nr:hypothetical protein [Muribaculaceae bacterium]
MKDKITIYHDGKPVAYADNIEFADNQPNGSDDQQGQWGNSDSLNVTAELDEESENRLRELFFEKSDTMLKIEEKFNELRQLLPSMLLVGLGNNGELAAASGGQSITKALCDAFEIYDDFKLSFTSLCIALIHTNDQFRSIITQVINDEKVIHL